MKTLTIVPMIHTGEELGHLADFARKLMVQKLGALGAKNRRREIGRYWEEVARRIRGAGFHDHGLAQTLHIFVDGLPNVEVKVVEKIITELTAAETPAYLIIKELLEAGASVHGTEAVDFLLQEHGMWSEAEKGGRVDTSKMAELLHQRDLAIAKRIDEVVPDGGLALLFIGAAHDVAKEIKQRKTEFRIVLL